MTVTKTTKIIKRGPGPAILRTSKPATALTKTKDRMRFRAELFADSVVVKTTPVAATAIEAKASAGNENQRLTAPGIANSKRIAPKPSNAAGPRISTKIVRAVFISQGH